MRSLIIAAGVAVAGLGASSASAQWWGNNNYNYGSGYGYRSNVASQYQRAIYQTQQQCNQALRYARSQRQYNRTARWCDERIRELQAEYRQQLRYNNNGWYGRNWEDRDRYRDRDRDWDDDDDDD